MGELAAFIVAIAIAVSMLMLSGAAALRIAFGGRSQELDDEEQEEDDQEQRVKAHEADLVRRLDVVQRGKFGVPMAPGDAGPPPPAVIRRPAGPLVQPATTPKKDQKKK